jgi:hypothetical protein
LLQLTRHVSFSLLLPSGLSSSKWMLSIALVIPSPSCSKNGAHRLRWCLLGKPLPANGDKIRCTFETSKMNGNYVITIK